MEQYIPKSALVAEIERQKIGYNVDGKHSVEYDTTRKILNIIDTLEVKEVDLENSMLCKVDWYDGFILDYTQAQQDELLNKIGANVGDKIRVILIKE